MTSITNKKALVTGAAGFIGSYIVEDLLLDGYDVIALDLGDAKKITHLKDHKNLKVVKADILQFDQLLSIIEKEKPDYIFHVAALLKSVSDEPFEFFEANVNGTLNVLEASKRAGIKKLIYSSSMAVYGDAKDLPVDELDPVNPDDFYGQSKLMGEELCKWYANHYGLNIIILRYSGVYGPRRDSGAVANFIKNAKANEPLKIDKNISWDQVYVKDVSKANLLALQKIDQVKFEVINIGSGKELPIKDLAKMIIDVSKSASKVELQEGFTDTPEMRFYFDISKAKELLGFVPTLTDEALKEYIGKI